MKQRITATYFLLMCCHWAIIAGVSFNLGGCAARPLHPGTANKFDSGVYDTLMTANNVINGTKNELSNGSFPTEVQPRVKAALNTLIDVYNKADVLYCNPPAGAGPTDSCAANSYHALAQAGKATTTDEANMKAKISDVERAVTALAAAKGPNKATFWHGDGTWNATTEGATK